MFLFQGVSAYLVARAVGVLFSITASKMYCSTGAPRREIASVKGLAMPGLLEMGCLEEERGLIPVFW